MISCIQVRDFSSVLKKSLIFSCDLHYIFIFTNNNDPSDKFIKYISYVVNVLWSLSQWMWYMYCMLKEAFCCQLHWNVSQSTDAENVFRAVEGETVDLPCHSPPNDSEIVSVKWTKHSTSSTTICELKINIIQGSLTGDCVPPFTFNINHFTLNIENVQLSDSGYYRCKTTRIIPPPSLDNTTNVTLQVAGERNS